MLITDNTFKFTTDKIYWTNESEDKPSREALTRIKWDEMVSPNIIISEIIFGRIDFKSQLTNITAVLFRNEYYLIEKKIALNNNMTAYTLRLDMWSNLVLPFLETQRELFPVRSTNPLLYSPLLKDNLVDKIPLQYLPYKSEFPDAGIAPVEGDSDGFVLENIYIQEGFTYVNETDTTILVEKDTNNVGNFYFVFKSDASIPLVAGGIQYYNFKVNKMKNNFVAERPVTILDPFMCFPVINNAELKAGSKNFILDNNFSYLTDLSQKAGAGFIGIFKGPPSKYVNERFADGNELVPYTGFVAIDANVGQEKQTKRSLFYYTGYDVFAELSLPNTTDMNVPVIGKLINIQIENTLWTDKDYYFEEQRKLKISFNGGGFFGYIQKPNNPKITGGVIDYGSFLISSNDKYQEFITANKSRQNAGLANSTLVPLNVAANAAMNFKGNPVGAAIGVAQSGLGLIQTVRNLNATKADMKRSLLDVVKSTDINDTVAAVLSTTYEVGIDPSYVAGSWSYQIQRLSKNTLDVIQSIYDRFGWPSQGKTTWDELSSTNDIYFELDMQLTVPRIAETGLDLIRQQEIINQLSYGIRVKV